MCDGRASGLLKGLRRLPAVLVTLGLSGVLVMSLSAVSAAGPAAAASPSGSTPKCKVDLSVSGLTATATVIYGCAEPGYYFSSWITPTDHWSPTIHEVLYQAIDGSPWTIQLPTSSCYWEIDFAYRNEPPGIAPTQRTLIAAEMGQISPCSPTQTSTPSTTLVNPGPSGQPPAPGKSVINAGVPASGLITTVPPSGGGAIPPAATTPATNAPAAPGAPGPATSTASAPARPPADTTTTSWPAVYQALSSSAAPSAKGAGSWAFPLFLVLIIIFAALTLIGAVLAVRRMNRAATVASWHSGPGGPPQQ